MRDGELIRDGEAFVLRFERDLAYPIERVWRAITDRADLAAWFPSTPDIDLRVGGKAIFVNDPDFAVDPDLLATTGEVVELDSMRTFAFTWGDDLLRFELSPTDTGCRIVFTHRLPHRASANRTVSGWSVCLDSLTASLSGLSPAGAHWRDYYDHYVREFGDGGVVSREDNATVVRFERLLPAPASTVWSAVTDPARWDGPPGVAGEAIRESAPRVVEYSWNPDAASRGVVKWQLIPIGECTLLLLTHTVVGAWDSTEALGRWDRVLMALAAELA